MNNNEQWYAIVADQDVFYEDGKLEYAKGSVVSYGTVIDEKALRQRGLRPVLLSEEPNHTTHLWDSTTEKMIPREDEE